MIKSHHNPRKDFSCVNYPHSAIRASSAWSEIAAFKLRLFAILFDFYDLFSPLEVMPSWEGYNQFIHLFLWEKKRKRNTNRLSPNEAQGDFTGGLLVPC